MSWTRNQLLKMRRNIHLAATSLPDEAAVETPELFPKWVFPYAYQQGDRFQYGEKLYKVLQAHTSQENWTPDAAPSLYAEVAHPGQGDTPDNPIPYDNNMELVEGKYYSQGGVTYVCTRSTGIPVYNDLSDLVGLYVEVWTG